MPNDFEFCFQVRRQKQRSMPNDFEPPLEYLKRLHAECYSELKRGRKITKDIAGLQIKGVLGFDQNSNYLAAETKVLSEMSLGEATAQQGEQFERFSYARRLQLMKLEEHTLRNTTVGHLWRVDKPLAIAQAAKRVARPIALGVGVGAYFYALINMSEGINWIDKKWRARPSIV